MYRFDSHLHQAGQVPGKEALPGPWPVPLEAVCMGWEPSSHTNTSLSQGWTWSSSDLTKGGDWTGGPGQPGNHSFPRCPHNHL